jgi:glycine/D-amino acid oxidase-like deaminating enzyme
VIGAGAVGAACASALARAGHQVRVLSHPGRSTTAVSGGHLLLQSKRPGPMLDLARHSLHLLAEFAAGREEELEYRQRGSLLLAASEEEIPPLRTQYDALAASGLPVEWLDGAATRALEPALSPGVVAASFCPLDAQVNPALLASAWLQDAMAHGTAVTSGASVEGFVTSRGGVCGVVAGGAEVPASAVVLAAGPWSGELAAMAGAAVSIRPRRGVLLHGRTDPPLTTRPLLGAGYLAAKFSDDPRGIGFSFQQGPDGACVLGGSREFVEFSAEGIEALREPILDCGTRYLPAVRELEWTMDAGFRPWTPDGLPRIGACEVSGLYLACGHEGDGITLAAATAEQIAAAIAQAVIAGEERSSRR